MSGKLAVRNRAPNPVQISAEQLLREAVQRQQEEVKAPQQRIVDEAELQEYRVRKRKEFEDAIRRQRHNLGLWIRYATWEATQMDFRRARSVFERALSCEFQNTGVWFKYIEMEMKNKHINSARNLLDRVTHLLPRVDQFWLKYVHMEEVLGNYAGVRAILERWMKWNPDDRAWMLYVRFEDRCGELGRAREIFERYLCSLPSQKSFLKFSKFEEQHRDPVRARAGFEKAIEVLPADALDEEFYIKFAEFEERQKQHTKVKDVFEQALKRCPPEKHDILLQRLVAFEKQRGSRESVERAVLDKRRRFYKEEITQNPANYDAWFDLLRLEEAAGDVDRIRETYETAVSNRPVIEQKRYWQRYIYLWINFAIFEEVVAADPQRCRQVFDRLIELIPHRLFSFAKVWILYAEFEVRQLELTRARRIFGRAIAVCGKPKIFATYSNLELRLGCIDRCRTIYSKFIEQYPTSHVAWISMIDVELIAEEVDRARQLCEIALELEFIDDPEAIWKRYIDLEISRQQWGRARSLYERLLRTAEHFRVYQAFAIFEFELLDDIEAARVVLLRGIGYCKRTKASEERKLLIEELCRLEKANGDKAALARAQAMKPKRVKVRRKIVGPDGAAEGFEEITEYLFPDDESQAANLKILERAKAWKKRQQASLPAEALAPVTGPITVAAAPAAAAA